MKIKKMFKPGMKVKIMVEKDQPDYDHKHYLKTRIPGIPGSGELKYLPTKPNPEYWDGVVINSRWSNLYKYQEEVVKVELTYKDGYKTIYGFLVINGKIQGCENRVIIVD